MLDEGMIFLSLSCFMHNTIAKNCMTMHVLFSSSNEETPARSQCANKEIVSGNEIAFNLQRHMRNECGLRVLPRSHDKQQTVHWVEEHALSEEIILYWNCWCTRPWLLLIVCHFWRCVSPWGSASDCLHKYVLQLAR